MKKYKVEADELLHYLSKEINAENSGQAMEKYVEMIQNGLVDVVDSDFADIRATKIGETK